MKKDFKKGPLPKKNGPNRAARIGDPIYFQKGSLCSKKGQRRIDIASGCLQAMGEVEGNTRLVFHRTPLGFQRCSSFCYPTDCRDSHDILVIPRTHISRDPRDLLQILRFPKGLGRAPIRNQLKSGFGKG